MGRKRKRERGTRSSGKCRELQSARLGFYQQPRSGRSKQGKRQSDVLLITPAEDAEPGCEAKTGHVTLSRSVCFAGLCAIVIRRCLSLCTDSVHCTLCTDSVTLCRTL